MAQQKLTSKQEEMMLTGLNNFMKDFGIDEIQFGNKHSLKKTKGTKAQPIIKKKRNGN